jgi:hypothetical protein
MKRLFLLATLLTIATTGSLLADTLELADGTVLEGDFVGSSNGVIMFNPGGGIEAYPEAQVVGIYLSAGVDTATRMMESPQAAKIIVPAGTRLVLRMSDTVDSSRHGPGHRFRAQLEGALVVDGVTAVPKGTILHGRVTQSTQAGRVAGSAQLGIEFTDLMIDDELVPIATGELRGQTEGEGGRTVGRTARAAAIGGLAGGSSGAKRGARFGAGVSILTAGASINVPRGSILETQLAAPLVLSR